jgi:hypothetical protein
MGVSWVTRFGHWKHGKSMLVSTLQSVQGKLLAENQFSRPFHYVAANKGGRRIVRLNT